MSYVGGEHGIMSAIMTMTNPPSLQDSNSKGGKNGNNSGTTGQKKSSRRELKELTCEGCGDIGDFILTCTECSVNYHPVCDDPPLDELLVKDLQWQCRSCRYKKFTKDQLELSFDNMPNLEKDETNGDVVMKDQEESTSGNGIVDENKSNDNGTSEARQMATLTNEASMREVKKLKGIFTIACNKAKATNPSIFEIPHSFRTNQYNFPGTSRSLVRKPGGIKLKPTIIDLENYCVPRPIMLCFHCGKSCRPAPLLKCDYCPKFFHFDCINPPLTTPPVGLWICPLHPEPFLETKLLKTTQLSHRVRLWDMTHRQVDRSSVVINFLSKCSRKDPPFAMKVVTPQLIPHEIPEIEGNLSTPSSGEPDTVISFMDTEKLKKNMDTERKQQLYRCYRDTITAPDDEAGVQIQFNHESLDPLNNIIEIVVNNDDVEMLPLQQKELEPQDEEMKDEPTEIDTDLPTIKSHPSMDIKLEPITVDESVPLLAEPSPSNPYVDSLITPLLFTSNNPKIEITDYSIQFPNNSFVYSDNSTTSNSTAVNNFEGFNSKTEEMETSSDCVAEVESPSKVAVPAIEECVSTTETAEAVEKSDIPMKQETEEEEMKTSIAKPLSAGDLAGVELLLQAATEVEFTPRRRMEFLQGLSKEQVYDLAAQKLAEFDACVTAPFASTFTSVQQNIVSFPLPPPQNDNDEAQAKKSSAEKIVKNGIHFYVLNTEKILRCSANSITIGTGNNADDSTSLKLNPQEFVTCPRLSDYHAVIFFDRTQKQWEILNYSPFGITVDHVRYSLNPKKADSDEENNDLEAMKAKILRHRKILVAKQMNPRSIPMVKDIYNQKMACTCLEEQDSCHLKVKNEGSAVIQVGSRIQIGCLKMVVKQILAEEEEIPNAVSASFS